MTRRYSDKCPTPPDTPPDHHHHSPCSSINSSPKTPPPLELSSDPPQTIFKKKILRSQRSQREKSSIDGPPSPRRVLYPHQLPIKLLLLYDYYTLYCVHLTPLVFAHCCLVSYTSFFTDDMNNMISYIPIGRKHFSSNINYILNDSL